MFNVGGGELLVIALIALIVLGPQRLPDAARQVGRVMGDLRRISSGFQQELKVALDDDDRPGPARRKESVPLASTVADADKGRTVPAGERDDAGRPGPGGSSGTDVGPPAVAPAVAAALDEIVTPITGGEGDDAAATDEPTTPGDGTDGLDDHRAAS